MTSRTLCTFHLDDHFLGLDVAVVQEILRQHPITPVPLAGDGVLGLINLRGHIVPAISLRSVLGIPLMAARRSTVHVVLRQAERRLSLVVDSIGDVLEVTSDQFEASPHNLDERIRQVTRGIYKLDPKLLLDLDPARIFDPRLSLSASGAVPTS